MGRARSGDALGAAEGAEAVDDRGKKGARRGLSEKVDCGGSGLLERGRLDVRGRGDEQLGEGAALRGMRADDVGHIEGIVGVVEQIAIL